MTEAEKDRIARYVLSIMKEIRTEQKRGELGVIARTMTGPRHVHRCRCGARWDEHLSTTVPQVRPSCCPQSTGLRM